MHIFDVIVVGGGTAGLSGALTLARARRSVLVLDAGEPRNAPAAGVHGFLAHDGIAPADLIGLGTAEVVGYGGQVMRARVSSAGREGQHFTVGTDDERTFTARRLLITTGLVDELPDVPGLRERWGRDVLHCPYCHGWEVRDQPIGVLGTGPFAVHQTLLFRQWSADVTLFVHTAPDLTPEEREQLDARDVRIVDGPVAALEITDDRLTGARMASGEVVPRRALTVMPRFVARADAFADLGLTTVEHPLGIGRHIEADASGLTCVPGVRVAGNVTDPMGAVVTAAAAGVVAAAATNADLVAEDTRLAVERRRTLVVPAAAAASGAEEFWEGFYGQRESHWSGNPNPVLVDVAGNLEPRTALDLGCGEGGDAIWLADLGWHVTAVDVSTTALDRAAATATIAGVDTRIDWQRHDLATTFPQGSYDLVSAQYLHSPVEFPREQVLRAAARAVAPGGLLLIVGHAAYPPWADHPHPDLHLPSPEEVLESLDLSPGLWRTDLVECSERKATGPDGRPGVFVDSVVAITRRADSGPSRGPGRSSRR